MEVRLGLLKGSRPYTDDENTRKDQWRNQSERATWSTDQQAVESAKR